MTGRSSMRLPAARQAWHAQHSGRQAEPAGVRATLAERRAAIDRYRWAFEAQRLPESTCAHRLAELDRQVQGLEARRGGLEAECDTTPTMATDHLLAGIRGRIERAVAEGAPQQPKQLLDAVVDRILVESRVHPAVLLYAHGSYAHRFAEADR